MTVCGFVIVRSILTRFLGVLLAGSSMAVEARKGKMNDFWTVYVLEPLDECVFLSIIACEVGFIAHLVVLWNVIHNLIQRLLACSADIYISFSVQLI